MFYICLTAATPYDIDIFREVIPPPSFFLRTWKSTEVLSGYIQYVLFIASRLFRAGGKERTLGWWAPTYPPCTFISLGSSLSRIRNQPPERSCYTKIKSQPARKRRRKKKKKKNKKKMKRNRPVGEVRCRCGQDGEEKEVEEEEEREWWEGRVRA